MSKPKTGLAKYLSELRYRLIWNKEARQRSALAHAAFSQQSEITLSDIKAFLRSLAPRHCGSELVRIGPNEDGGYLLPDDLSGVSALFSPGVSETLGFDLGIAERGTDCFLADASVSAPNGLLPNMRFDQKFIGPYDEGDFMTMRSWIDDCAPGKDDLLLQMDIEGAEYDVLPTISDDTLRRFRIMLIEFHDFDGVFDPVKFDRFRKIFDRLNETHQICHLHANNTMGFVTVEGVTVPPVFEATYLRRDRITGELPLAQIPHPLDQHNSIKRPNADTPAFWSI